MLDCYMSHNIRFKSKLLLTYLQLMSRSQTLAPEQLENLAIIVGVRNMRQLRITATT
jgi:hypothetical protein